MRTYDWDFEVIVDWQKITGNKWLIVSPTDEVVNYERASLYKKIKRTDPASLERFHGTIRVIKLPKLYISADRPMGHNLPLDGSIAKPAWEQHRENIRRSFHQFLP